MRQQDDELVAAVAGDLVVRAQLVLEQRGDLPQQADGRDVYNVLPPGQFGGLPVNDHSKDQMALYDGLTPLFDQVQPTDLTKYFKSEALGTGTDGPVTIDPIPPATARTTE